MVLIRFCLSQDIWGILFTNLCSRVLKFSLSVTMFCGHRTQQISDEWNLTLTSHSGKCKKWFKLKEILVSLNDTFLFPSGPCTAENLSTCAMYTLIQLSERLQVWILEKDFTLLIMLFQGDHDRLQRKIFSAFLNLENVDWPFSELFCFWVWILSCSLYEKKPHR